MNSVKVREQFLSFFKSKAHEIVPSAPLVVKDDPTLLFTNAGMNQFKDWFLGNSTPKFKRVADTQKCLRVSGKHNDLEEVGVDTYHHTLFEMLGNWSFGDYFKKEAIEWSWELLTKVYGIPAEQLYVTVFEGSKADNLAFDQEAFDAWKKWIPEERILKGNKKDNFWEMGDAGPCGPCSEIHVDIRDAAERKKGDGAKLVNSGHPQVIEIWNNVFMEFNRKSDGSLEKLPARHVDTGMGFERLCMVLQGKQSSYDTDVFQPLIKKVEDLSGLRYKPADTSRTAEIVNIGMRVIADHIRAISFAIADGQLPSNTGAGYVIRRILRRAVRYGYQSLGLKEAFLHRLVPVLSHQMGDAFPELNVQKVLIEKVIREEEISFFKTLENGLKKIDQVCIDLVNKKESQVDGKTVFELYDTYGFPVDLTALIARGYELKIDEKGFTGELDKQKKRSREATNIDTGDWDLKKEFEPTVFVGYSQDQAESQIIQMRTGSNKKGVFQHIVLDKTPFYAESGGQVGDTGKLIVQADDGATVQIIDVIDVKKENNLLIHITAPIHIPFPHKKIISVIDSSRRNEIKKNHSATHLLHAALRKVLGTHVEQKGSLVNEEHLRFDFTHFSKLTDEEIQNVQRLVNTMIRKNVRVMTEEMPLEKAKQTGAMALFGEKYGDSVRVVTMDKDYSIELCGGTHVNATGEIGFFKITSESAIAAGIRRIEAITSEKSEEYVQQHLDLIHKIREVLGNSIDPLKSITELRTSHAELKKQVESFTAQKANQIKKDLRSRIKNQAGIQLLVERIDLDSADAVKNIAFEFKDTEKNMMIVLGGIIKGKPSLTVAISEDLVKAKNLNAGTIVRELAKEIQGGGGGQPFYATAGGTDTNGLEKALAKARQLF
ncbi:MAG: alanine--tRNA ligase [Bacteroidia bacterium]|nr:alanine--tRNA ligase [Bacteroidia bacterium]